MLDRFKYIVNKKNDGLTIKELLIGLHLAKNKFNYLIDNKKIYLNSKCIIKRETILHTEDIVEIELDSFDKISYKPVRYNLDIVYEDDYMVVVNKPKGIIIYSDDENELTMANYMSYYYEKTGQRNDVRHVHRLDKNTSGLLIYAKDPITHAYLSNLFEEKDIKKEYYALVKGIIKEKGTINKKIGRNRHDNSMIINEKGLETLTIYTPIKVIDNSTLLDVEIKTGRKHQIRVHMASINHPLVGDEMYGDGIGDYLLICHHIGFYSQLENSWMDFNINMNVEELIHEKIY